MNALKYLPLLVLFACSNPTTPVVEAPTAEKTPPVVEKTEAQTEGVKPSPKEEPKVAAYSITDEWNALLSYVTDDGGYRYQALIDNEEHKAQLQKLVSEIATTDVSKKPKLDRLAHYINAYNILTVASVVESWPLKSVMKVDGFFDKKKHNVGGKEMTLNALENEVIRGDEFAEPRIHFAVNCASTGCPWLHNKAMESETLDETLELLTKNFITRTTVIDTKKKRAKISKIFEWFKADFTRDDNTVRGFVAKYLAAEEGAFVEKKRTKLVHFDYDWAVNAR